MLDGGGARQADRCGATREQRTITEYDDIAVRDAACSQLYAEFGADARRLARGDGDPRAVSS